VATQIFVYIFAKYRSIIKLLWLTCYMKTLQWKLSLNIPGSDTKQNIHTLYIQLN